MKNITVKNVKKYLLDQVRLQDDIDAISTCIKRSQLAKYVADKEYFYYKSIDRLQASDNFAQLEYHLCMMNELYVNEKYEEVKSFLFRKLIHKKVDLKIFKVLLACNQLPETVLIEYLYKKGRCNALSAARFALYIDQPYIALNYLKELDDCDDDVVLRLLCGFSKTYYIELIAYYNLKKGKVLNLAHA